MIKLMTLISILFSLVVTAQNKEDNIDMILKKGEVKTETKLKDSSKTEVKEKKEKKEKEKKVKKNIKKMDIKPFNPFRDKKTLKKIRKKLKRKSTKKREIKKKSEWWKSGIEKDYFLLSGSIGNELYGYYDSRYKNYEDEHDYIKSQYQTVSIEYYRTGFKNLNGYLKDLKMGTNVLYNHRNNFDQKTLYEIPGLNISEQTVPNSMEDYASKFYLNIGFFIGLNKKWFGLDFGLTYKSSAIYESFRLKHTENSTYDNPLYKKVDGRGWVWESGSLIPNFSIRFGKEDTVNFTLDYLRGDYDPIYGELQTKIHIPITKMFHLDIGGYLHPTDSIFIAPSFIYNNFVLSLKFGTVVDYNETYLDKVGVVDSLFGKVSLSYEW